MMSKFAGSAGHPALLLLIAGAWNVANSARADGETFSKCDRAVRAAPKSLEGFHCYSQLVRKGEAPWDDAVERLRQLASAQRYPRPQLYLAGLLQDEGDVQVEPLYLDAIKGFASEGDRSGEVTARVLYSSFLRSQGRLKESETVSNRAAELAAESKQPSLIAECQLEEAWLLMAKSRYADAWAVLNRIERKPNATGPLELKARLYDAKAQSAAYLGQTNESIELYGRAIDIAKELGDQWLEARLRHGRFLASRGLVLTNAERAAELGRILEAAHRGHALSAELAARSMLPDFVKKSPQERLAESAETLKLARKIKELRPLCAALRDLAIKTVDLDPSRRDEAYQLIDECLDRARGAQLLPGVASSATARFQVGWASKASWEQVYADALKALDAIEQLRNSQAAGVARAKVFAPYTEEYFRLSGFLLRRGTPESKEVAFQVIERLRAQADPTTAEGGPPSQSSARLAFVKQIIAAQRRLTETGLSESERKREMEELQRAEAEELALGQTISREPAAPLLPTLGEVQRALDRGQALISFQMTTEHIVSRSWGKAFDTGGSWVFVFTGDEVRVRPLGDRREVESLIRVQRGAIMRRDSSDLPVTVRLFDQLLKDALADLPSHISRLVIVPDGMLYLLPFGSLRQSPSSPPLATRYEISVVPSAAMWRRWKSQPPVAARIPLLALADPSIAVESHSSAYRELAPWVEGLKLGHLPGALEEGRSATEAMGGGSQLLAGANASEKAVKEADLGQFSVVHFAAHAVTDEDHPERSAIVLSPGSPDEDGLLQLRDISKLKLAGKVVVLSACRSSSGEVVWGEGTLSLARAFFQAGASAVIGSLWPVEDASAVELFRTFYHQLARGKSIAAALAEAQREAIHKNAPAAVWGNLVIIGNGDIAPFQSNRIRPAAGYWAGLIAGLGAALLIAAVYLRRRSRSLRIRPSLDLGKKRRRTQSRSVG